MDISAMQQMLVQFTQMREKVEKQIEQVAVEASAGGGMVVVKMNGKKQVTDVRIEPNVFSEKDPEMLQDLIRAAVNEAGRRVDDELQSQMRSIAGNLPSAAGLRIPGLF